MTSDNPLEQSEQSIISADSLSFIESQERANIDMLIATAKKYPRDIVQVKRNMEAMATLDEETAESCNYHLERNGKSIDGPSVRMAEIAVAAYKNIRCGSRVIANDGKVITGQAFCHDLENNTFIAWETQRRITDKHGRVYGEDMQVVTGNAASAIAFRNAVFKVIPGALIKPVAEKAKQVAVGDLKTLTQRRTRALNRLVSLGIKEEQILRFLSRASIEQMDIVDVQNLFGVFTAIREGSTTIEEQFPVAPKVAEPKFGSLVETQEPSRPVASSGEELPRPRRGRPPKVTAPESGKPAEEPAAPAPQTPEPEPAPKQPEAPEPAPVAAPAPQQRSLFGGERSSAAEITRRLAEARISQERFLEVLLDNEIIDCERGDITSGDFGLDKVQPAVLEHALRDWNQVLQILKQPAK